MIQNQERDKPCRKRTKVGRGIQLINVRRVFLMSGVRAQNKHSINIISFLVTPMFFLVSQARPFINRRGEGKGLVKLHRHLCSHNAMTIVADMCGNTPSCASMCTTAAIELGAFLSSAGNIVILNHRARSIRNC